MHDSIPRVNLLQRIQKSLGRAPVVALLGARQAGKTTLARQLVAGLLQPVTWFDLELPVDRHRLTNPQLTLEPLRGVVVIDEIQQLPHLFGLLRALVDRPGLPAQFVILGSAAPDTLRGASESLAGRVEFIEVPGFAITEVEDPRRLWLRGGFPRSYLAASEENSLAWRDGFIQTFLQRDLALLSPRVNQELMRRFWTMLAHYHGQTWNGAELGRALGLTAHTVRGYLDLLTGTYMVRALLPWFANVGKRLVKAPKVYLRDSGIVHRLLGIDDALDLESHPKVGASWEGFALEQVLRHIPGDPYVYTTHGGAEIDLILLRRKQRWGFEFKRAEAPTMTRSMAIGMADLKLDHLWVVYPGEAKYPIERAVTAIPLAAISKLSEGDPVSDSKVLP